MFCFNDPSTTVIYTLSLHDALPISFAYAEIRTYNFNVGWVTRNPDGLFDRPVIGINGQWPIPRIEATDRKSTRLNSSHRCISYAVFCLKKKKKTKSI